MNIKLAFCLIAVSASVAAEEYPEWEMDASREPEYLRTCEEYAQGTIEQLEQNPLYDDGLLTKSYTEAYQSCLEKYLPPDY